MATPLAGEQVARPDVRRTNSTAAGENPAWWQGTTPYIDLRITDDQAVDCSSSLKGPWDAVAVNDDLLAFIENRQVTVVAGETTTDLRGCLDADVRDLQIMGLLYEDLDGNSPPPGYRYDNDINGPAVMALSAGKNINDTTLVIGLGNALYFDAEAESPWLFPGVIVISEGFGTSASTSLLQHPELESLTMMDNPEFGRAVAISSDGSLLAVGAPQGLTNEWQGKVFLFQRDAQGAFDPEPVATFQDPGSPWGPNNHSNRFGQAVALSADGRYLVVGAGGVAEACGTTSDCPQSYAVVYDLDTNTNQYLTPYDRYCCSARKGRAFGVQVAIHDDLIAVAAPGDINNPEADSGEGEGAIYLFRLHEQRAEWAPIEPKLYHHRAIVACGIPPCADPCWRLGERWLKIAAFGETGRLVVADAVGSAKSVFISRAGDFADTASLTINGTSADSPVIARDSKNVFAINSRLMVAMGVGPDNGYSISRVGVSEVLIQELSWCPQDIVRDTSVNVTDLLAVIANWNRQTDDIAADCQVPLANLADVNRDGIVAIADLLAVIGAWGDCP
jgi:hypothetical protein